jgi:hypothetical protein
MNEIGKHVQTLIDRDLYRRLIVKCDRQNIKIAEAIRQAIKEFVKDIDVEEVKAYA